MEPVLTFGELTLTPYGLTLAAGTLLSLLVSLYFFHRSGLSSRDCATAYLVSIPSGLIFGHLVWCLGFFDTVEAEDFLMLWRGGYTLYGAILGILLCVYLTFRKSAAGFPRVLDALAPGAAVLIAAGRLAEAFTDQGVGAVVENELLWRLPFSVCTYADADYAEWQTAVFLWEAVMALVLFVYAAWLFRKKLTYGGVAFRFLSLLSASQIVLEQLRQDDKVRFGYVSLTQLLALAVLIALVATRVREEGLLGKTGLLFGLTFLFSASAIVFLEFSIQKAQFYPFLMISGVLEAGACFLFAHEAKERKTGHLLVLSLVALVSSLAGCFTEEFLPDVQPLFFYGAMVLYSLLLHGLCVSVAQKGEAANVITSF